MSTLLNPTGLNDRARAASAAPDHDEAAAGVERRRAADSPLARWCEQMLDEVEHGVLLLDEDARLLHANYAARRELTADHPLQVLGGRLLARCGGDVPTLHDALLGAARRGLRRLILLGTAAHRVALAVVPLQLPHGRAHAVQVSMGRQQVCGALSVQWYARGHGLTLTEARVLEALCEGMQPNAIAARHGVNLSTIRTQIGSLREKTRSDSIGALVRQVAVLPPLLGTLRGVPAPAEAAALAMAA